jgi:Family of unknown function (DUF6510)
MGDDQTDMDTALTLDGNAVAGKLQQIFGHDMTMAVLRCVGCARNVEMGASICFTRGPGVVMRCPACEAVLARIVETPAAVYIDMRGAAYVRLDARP